MPSRRLLTALVVASLAVNLFLAGLLAGDWLMGRYGPPPFAPAINPSWMRHALGPDAERMVAPVMRRHMDEIREHIEATRRARRAVGAALTAEPFDRAALEDALARIRTQNAEAQAAFHGAFVDVADKLSPEQRAELAKESQRRRRPPPF